MAFEVLRFAFRGVQFEYCSGKSADALRRKLKKLTVVRAAMRKTNGIVAIVRKDKATLYKLRVPVLQTGKPVLYVEIEDIDGKANVKGRFTFAVYARAIFWLLLMFASVWTSFYCFRLVQLSQQDIDAMFFMAMILKMIIGPLVAYIVYTWYNFTWRQCGKDMKDIAAGLEEASK